MRKQSKSLRRAALVAVGSMMATAGYAAIIPWNAAVSGNYSEGTRWTGGVAPTAAADTAQFNVAGTYNVTLDISPSITELSVGGSNVTFLNSTVGRTFTLSGPTALFLSSGSLTLNAAQPIAINAGTFTTINAPLSIQAGSDLSLGSTLNIGNIGTAGAVTVNGSGSTLTGTGQPILGNGAGTSGSLTLQNNATGSFAGLTVAATASGGSGTVTIQSGADLSTTGANVLVGTAGIAGQSGSLTVTGSGSTLTMSGGFVQVNIGATSTSTGTVTVSSSGLISAGSSTLTVHSTGLLDIQSGGDYTTSGNVDVTTTSGSGTQGKIVVAGSGSAFIQSTASTLTVGNATSGAGTIQVDNLGTFTTGSGLTTINNTGTILINSGGTYNANGNITINGGLLHRNAPLASAFTWASAKTMNVQNGGEFLISLGNFTLPTSAIINVTGAGSEFNMPSGAPTISGGSQLNITAGGDCTVAGASVGVNTSGTMTVDGSGSSYSAGALTIANNTTGTVTFSNSATGTVTGVVIVGNSLGATGTMNVNTGATFTQTGSGTLGVGTNSTGSNILHVQSGGTYSSGTGLITVGPSGNINVNGGTFNANGDILINGGTLQRTSAPTGGFGWASGKTMNVQSGGDVILSLGGLFLNANTVNVTGSGALFNGAITVSGGSQYNVTAGGDHDGSLEVGVGSGSGTLLADGVGTTLTNIGGFWGFQGGSATVTIQNGATATGTNSVVMGFFGYDNTSADVTVQSGGTLTLGALDMGNAGGTGSNFELTVTGAGSAASFPGGLGVGTPSSGTAVIDVLHDASLTAGPTSLNATGTINITNATVSLGALTHNGGAINFNSGSLSFGGNLTVGTGGMLGTSLTLDSTRTLSLTGTTTIDPFRTLTLSGGMLNTGSLVNNGTFNFTAGTLGITGAGGLTIGGGGSLGSSLTVGAGRTVNVTNTTTVSSTGLLVLESGGTVNATAGLTNNGEVHLDGFSSQIAGGTLTNNKLILGNGRIANSFTNASAGEVRASGADRLVFTAASNTNNGKINLLNSGTVEFTGALTNSSTGRIAGRGTLIVSNTLSNNGQVMMTAGFSDIFGPVTNNNDILITGGGTTTFYDPVNNAAAGDINVAANSAVVFLDAVTGSGTLTGSGTKYFADGTSSLMNLDTPGHTVVEAPAELNVSRVREVSLDVRGLMEVSQNGTSAATSRVDQLAVSGQIDLADNKLIVAGNVGSWNGSGYTGVTGMVAAGYNGGSQDGNGIITSQSSAISPNVLTALVVMSADDAGYAGGVFGGLNVNSGDALIMYSWGGDANMDGTLNGDDYFQIDSNIALAGSVFGYKNGDFNYDGDINGDDYFIIDSNIAIGQNAPPFPVAGSAGAMTAVPEPAGSALFIGAASALALRSRGRRA